MQHTASNKHRRLSLALQTNRVPAGSKESLAERTDCNYREIPMLSMFLQRLHQHHYFPPIRVSLRSQANYYNVRTSPPHHLTTEQCARLPDWIGSFRNCKHFRAIFKSILAVVFDHFSCYSTVEPPWSQQLCSVRCVSVSIVADLTD